MPTTIIDNEPYPAALARRMGEEAAFDRKVATPHTAGPWAYEMGAVVMRGQVVITDAAPDGAPIEERRANSRRIVACVNACEGLTTEEVEGIPVRLDLLARDYRAMKSERDELLALLESFGHKPGCRRNAFGEECTCGVDSAIAKAKRGIA